MALSPSDVEDLVSRFVKDPSYIGNFTSLEEGEEPLLHYRLSQYNHVHFSAVDAEDNGAYHIFTLAGSIRFIDSKLSGNFDESAPFPRSSLAHANRAIILEMPETLRSSTTEGLEFLRTDSIDRADTIGVEWAQHPCDPRAWNTPISTRDDGSVVVVESVFVADDDWDIEFAHKSKPLPLPPQYAVEPFTRFVQPRTKEEQPKGNDVDRKRIWLPRPRVPIGKMDLSGTLLHKLDWADLETRDFVRVMVSPRFWKTSNRRGYYLEMMGIEVYGKFLIGTPKRKDPVQKMGTPKKGPMAIFSQLE